MEKYGFVYIWFDKKHKRFYIGCRWGYEDDSYICSSSWMKNSYKKRPHDFKRKILSRIYTNKKDLLEEEYEWLQLIKNEELGKKYYNLHNHHFGHWSTDENKKLTISEKLKNAWTDDMKEKQRKDKLGEKNPMKNPEVVEKVRQKNIGRIAWNTGLTKETSESLKIMGENHSKRMKGRTPPNKGVPMSDEQKNMISIENKKRKWCYHKETNKIIHILKELPIPEGYLPGRGKVNTRPNKAKPMSNDQKQFLSELRKNSKWCYNPNTDIIINILKEAPIPEGFVLGRRKNKQKL